MDRYYKSHLQEFIQKKIILITGPRQSGKTTLSKSLDSSFEYLNYDFEKDRKTLRVFAWDRAVKMVILDEIHKMPSWKRWLKGIYDTQGLKPYLVVTGSSKMDTYKKVGDSLAGRFFQYRIHPFDIKELVELGYNKNADAILDQLLIVSGFPEPFLEGNQKFYELWKKSHLDIILRQDLIDQESVRNIHQIELLINLLSERVGSTISYLSLARDLQVSDKTIKKWLTILENMYVVFKVTPYSKKIARSNIKQPKYYFYDYARVDNMAARLENLVACALLKESHFREDCLGEKWDLHYLAKKGLGEIDFCITKNNSPHLLIEVKTSDDEPSPSFKLFKDDLLNVSRVQLVKNLKKEKTYPDGLEIRKLGPWLVKGIDGGI